ncbi:bifunctional DNA-formamidopyrimidine glycosylase/DNA-(apurinic or apyrimidinic site) lyase [Candidatus Kaiserbacteria bacterium]|nr:bifunctional DNA-formamidopyrimidine glycosylase/DNA-(apurinic or apyrimidinic site) lyase [Candidatus Kaiserbacteria bacterium]
MPELPEVETVRVQLIDKVVGKKIKGVEVFHDKTVGFDEDFEQKLLGKIISDIGRVGKLLFFSFKNESDLFMLAHLKMTGQFFYVSKNEVVTGGGHSMTENDMREFPGRHTRCAFYFADGTSLYFNDMRIFGYLRLVDKPGLETAKSGYGPEPIDPDFDIDWFLQKLKRRNTNIKAVLLDQTFVSGLGNIYVDEALWRAKVLPERQASSLSKREATALAVASKEVMLESILKGGTTFQSFADTEGREGNFRDYLKVFGRQGQICERCGGEIKKIRVAGRGTHFCSKCQR